MIKKTLILIAAVMVSSLGCPKEKVLDLEPKEETKADAGLNEPRDNNQGCCSFHGGICGNDAEDNIVCCDGVVSPSCDLD